MVEAIKPFVASEASQVFGEYGIPVASLVSETFAVFGTGSVFGGSVVLPALAIPDAPYMAQVSGVWGMSWVL